MKKRQVSILITSVALGLLIVSQAKSFTNVTDRIGRDVRADVFREIQILKNTNKNLQDEIVDLEDQLAKASDQDNALDGIRQEIEKYKILSGRINISGPGISLQVEGDMKSLWLTDIVNELFSAGAEAVSVNSIRLTDTTSGFDTIPNGQILLNGIILKQPYVFEAIGDRKILEASFHEPQGILERMSQNIGGFHYTLEQRDLVTIEKVL